MNIPSLPDSFLKSIFLICIVAIYFLILQLIENKNKEKGLVDQYNIINDSLNAKNILRSYQDNQLLWKSNLLALKHNLINPISRKDSIIYFKPTGQRELAPFIDSFSLMYSFNKDLATNYEIEVTIFKGRKRAIDEAIALTVDMGVQYEIGLGIALFILGISVAGLWHGQRLDNKIKLRELNDKPPYYPCCQSCGKEFSALVVKGANKDGSVNTGFCNQCFSGGTFTYKAANVEEFTEQILKEELSRYKVNKRNRIINKIRHLDRWRSSY